MTEKKIDNSLYTHLASAINQALPLEYAIRAAHLGSPHEMAALAEIDEQIRQHWLSLGASDDSIRADQLVDMAWDTIQVGFPMGRRHGLVFTDLSYVELIHEGLETAPAAFAEQVEALRCPATAYFRICDLLNGNDISALLRKVGQCLSDARGFEAEDDIPLRNFILGVREPIRLHPGLTYVVKPRADAEREVERFGIVLDTEMAFSMDDVQLLVREFLYQFAQRRQAHRSPLSDDPTSTQLIQKFLEDELLGRITPHKQDRVNGLLGPLAGLCCWDLVNQFQQEQHAAPVDSAVSTMMTLYPGHIGEPGMRKNYFNARRAIVSLPFSGVTPKKNPKATSKSNDPKSAHPLQAAWKQGH